MPLYLFFQCADPHRDLHSFPTRRSSDLPFGRLSMSTRVPSVSVRLFSSSIISGDLSCFRILSVAMRRADRKSTRLNSSHVEISYAVFCLKKKNDTVWKIALSYVLLRLQK